MEEPSSSHSRTESNNQDQEMSSPPRPSRQLTPPILEQPSHSRTDENNSPAKKKGRGRAYEQEKQGPHYPNNFNSDRRRDDSDDRRYMGGVGRGGGGRGGSTRGRGRGGGGRGGRTGAGHADDRQIGNNPGDSDDDSESDVTSESDQDSDWLDEFSERSIIKQIASQPNLRDRQNALGFLKTLKLGNRKRVSSETLRTGLILLLRAHISARQIPIILQIITKAWSINDSNVDYMTPTFFKRLRFSLPFLNDKFINEKLSQSENLTLFFGEFI